LLAAGLAVLYAPLAPELVGDWSRSGDFSHGFVVPVVTLWLLWRRRHEIRAAPSAPSALGALLLGAGVATYLLGVAASEFTLQRASIVPVLGGWIVLLWGWQRARPCVFPVVFLLFMIPPPTLVWNSVSLPLQLFASRVAEGMLRIGGVPLTREGNVIHLAGCSLEVAHACSGLRSLVMLLAMGALFAEGSVLGGGGPTGRAGRIVLVLAAVPVAVAVNALRVAGTAVAVSRFGPGAATGAAHEIAGAAVFVIALAALLATRKGIAWLESRRRA
jgi:exosortase